MKGHLLLRTDSIPKEDTFKMHEAKSNKNKRSHISESTSGGGLQIPLSVREHLEGIRKNMTGVKNQLSLSF